jgi:AraC family transcriptional regulator
MNVRFETKKAFKIAGLVLVHSQNDDFPGHWHRLFEQVPYEKLAALGTGEAFGTCFNYSAEPHSFSYIAGYDVRVPEDAHVLGLEVVEVPEAEYAIVELTGAVPENIHQGWEFVWHEYLPSHGLKHAGTPDHEFYFMGDMSSPDYKMELWVPIVRI